ncbi:QueF-like protein [Pyrodictium delaneyi]|nr:hypothetical protein [Pyrodictium delaneyi]ALL00275.1 QueF-like protein [Pyrodictium delaneyi]
MAEIRVVQGAEAISRVTLRSVIEAVCPLTGLVDRYNVEVEYSPGEERLYIEAYSFQEYLESYRGKRIYQEELAAKIAHDVCRAAQPRWVRVTLVGTHGSVEIEAEHRIECEK